ncbi:serine hydrolase [Lacimicrobium sp. SS2-24]|uniref:serine hydrolase domain-containing protein n=1 Tax=Lacimicrobium sp. SS2-24 TaxID=2005569 RepID=UPI001FEE38BB|nr:serine hydrolase [Lacimicrobium sp. SS2-24]
MKRKNRTLLSVFYLLPAVLSASFAVAFESPRQVAFADAEVSDPVRLGWMQGSPPPKDKLITHPQSDYFSFPKLRWTVCHIRQLLPTEQVSRGLGAPVPLIYEPDDSIDQLTFTPTGQDKPISWKTSLALNYTDGLLVLHRNKIIYEYYSGCLDELGQHAAMSMTKSLTGLLAEILIAQGQLDEQQPVKELIPELAESAFGIATIRQVMDMTTSIQYSEDYSDPNADIWQYSMAANPLPKPESYTGPEGYLEYLQGVKKQGEHGQVFAYKTVNSDALGWILSRATGKNVTELLSEKIWRHMGAEQDAYMTIDSKGTPFAGGGLSAGLRDLGRIGLLMLNHGRINGQQLFPSSVVKHIQQGGDKTAFAHAGYTSMPGGSYRSMWWLFHNENGAYAARGVHGQTIYIDPVAEMVIVRLASFPIAKNAYIDPTSLPAYEAVADYLIEKAKRADYHQ